MRRRENQFKLTSVMKRLNRYLLEPINTLTHLVAAVAAAIVLLPLLHRADHDLPKWVSLLVFGLSMIILYLSSALLHGLKVSPERRMWLNRVDHMAIFLLIAGTYTPIVYNLFPIAWRWLVLLPVWLVALIGMGFKLLNRRIHGFYHTTIYLILGWGSVLPFWMATNLFETIPHRDFALLLLGGLIYTVGFFVYYFQWPDPWPEWFGHHEIWHLFVMGGSVCHYLFMFWVVVPFARETAVISFPFLL